MPYIKTQSGIKWHYKIQGEKETIFFLHGWSFDMGLWHRQFNSFSQNYKVISLDLPGHGNSNYKKDIDMIRDLYFIVKKLKLSKINLVGHSFGGFLALKFAHTYPEVTRKLILIGTPAKFVKSDDYRYGLEEGDISKLRGFLKKDYPNILSVFVRWLFTKDERSQTDFKYIWNSVSKRNTWPNKEALGEFLDLIETEDLRSQINKIKLPTLIISGTNDPICPIESAHYLNKKIKSSKIELFDNCGHLPFLTEPERFNSLIRQFLN